MVETVTSMGIMATIAPAIGCHPVWIALACLSGGNSIGHVNDSGFWVATNMSGLTVTGGLKTYTLGSFISSVCIFVLALIGALVIPPVSIPGPHNMKEELYMQNAMIIDPKDNVAVAIEPIAKGQKPLHYVCGKRLYPSPPRRISSFTTSLPPTDHSQGPARGEKYGTHRCGLTETDPKAGEHVHVHNVESHQENLEEGWNKGRIQNMTFYGYRRPDGRVGVRNRMLILPASVCASDTTRIIAQQVEGAITFNNQQGCSQVAP